MPIFFTLHQTNPTEKPKTNPTFSRYQSTRSSRGPSFKTSCVRSMCTCHVVKNKVVQFKSLSLFCSTCLVTSTLLTVSLKILRFFQVLSLFAFHHSIWWERYFTWYFQFKILLEKKNNVISFECNLFYA